MRCSALGLTTLGGCACAFPSLPIGPIPPVQPGALAPPPAHAGSLQLPIVIDAHCHIFNVEDVPAAAFLKGPVALDHPEIIANLIRLMADLLAAIAYLIAPSARQEMWLLADYAAKHHALLRSRSPGAAGALIDELLDSQRIKFSASFSAVARDSAFAKSYRESLEEYDTLNRGPEGIFRGREANSDPLSQDAIYDVLRSSSIYTTSNRSSFNPRQLLLFGFTLTSPRFFNLITMQRTFSGDYGVPAIDIFCPSMLDLDCWLGCGSTATSQTDQMLLLEQIALASGGTVLPFVAYNPQTDIDKNNASYDRVVEAITKRGFIGVKIYPPMGYLAYDNVSTSRPDGCPLLPNAYEIDCKLRRLYEWCVANNVPVMGHTSHSFGGTSDKDGCASPFGWQQAVAAFDGLRVQAGHFGGDSTYALDNKWAAQYVSTMALPQARNLYADLSNLDQLFVAGSDVRCNIDPLFRVRLSAATNETASRRIIYGSDWYLTQLSNASDVYVARMSDYLYGIGRDNCTPELRAWVFGQNAVSLYGLVPGPVDGKETNWDRLARYYVRNGIPTPRWMRKLMHARGGPSGGSN
jgi:predicted TIM-barrel fold metal-dependent hydrolase